MSNSINKLLLEYFFCYKYIRGFTSSDSQQNLDIVVLSQPKASSELAEGKGSRLTTSPKIAARPSIPNTISINKVIARINYGSHRDEQELPEMGHEYMGRKLVAASAW
jgi:hypothetical protein